MSYWSYFPPYVSVAERKRKALDKLKKLMKKNKNLKPVMIEGKAIANTWWGKSWRLGWGLSDFPKPIRSNARARWPAAMDGMSRLQM